MNDQIAEEALKHRPKILRWLVNRGFHPREAEDISDAAIEKLITWDNFDPGIRSVKNTLYDISNQVIRDRVRKKNRQLRLCGKTYKHCFGCPYEKESGACSIYHRIIGGDPYKPIRGQVKLCKKAGWKHSPMRRFGNFGLAFEFSLQDGSGRMDDGDENQQSQLGNAEVIPSGIRTPEQEILLSEGVHFPAPLTSQELAVWLLFNAEMLIPHNELKLTSNQMAQVLSSIKVVPPGNQPYQLSPSSVRRIYAEVMTKFDEARMDEEHEKREKARA